MKPKFYPRAPQAKKGEGVVLDQKCSVRSPIDKNQNAPKKLGKTGIKTRVFPGIQLQFCVRKNKKLQLSTKF